MFFVFFLILIYTGNTLTPAILSTTGATAGCESRGPMNGTLLRKVTITAKKSPNNCKIPKVSIMKPMKECLIKINTIPRTNAIEPLSFAGRAKNENVFCGPIIRTKPMTNNKLPKANKAESKNVMTPSKKNTKPEAVKATPNSRDC